MKYLGKHSQLSCNLIAFIICSIFPCVATATNQYFSSLTYYTGFSIGYQHVPFKPGYGQGFLPQNTTDYEFFVGGQSLSNFGFEVGLTATPVTSKYSTLYGGDYYPGATRPLASGTWQTWKPQYENSNAYLGINRYMQILTRGKLRAFVFAGISYAYVQVITNFEDDDLPGKPDQAEQDAARDKFEAYHFIGMFKLGLEQNFTPRCGWRLAYTWKNYSAFGKISSVQYPDLPIGVIPKNTNAVYLSIFFNT